MPKDPQRVVTGRIGALKLHGLYSGKAITAGMRAGFLRKFRDEAAAAAAARGEEVTEAELDRRARYLRASHMQLMAYRREEARRQNKEREVHLDRATPAAR